MKSLLHEPDRGNTVSLLRLPNLDNASRSRSLDSIYVLRPWMADRPSGAGHPRPMRG